MHARRLLLAVALGTYGFPRVFGEDLAATIRNANHIFNEIHSSARQWGSTLNHNGMAFFLATIPEGTELYHGTSSNKSKTGMDWLAFEPEHALVFARPGSNRVQDHKDSPSSASTYGYLHTFRARHDLRLLYLDGASAAKSDRGTLDLQEVVLLQNEPQATTGRRSFQEHEEDLARASAMCRMVREDWTDSIDGFVRMEAGFEVIACDFEAHLEPVSFIQSKPSEAKPGVIPDSPAFFKAIASRYDSLGGDRIMIDYEKHVSLYAFPGAVYFDKWARPRVNHTSHALHDVRNAVRSMIADRSSSTVGRTNWQSVADMIVARYADRIAYLASGEVRSLADIRFEAERSLLPFVDYAKLNKSEEISRCKHHFIPQAGRRRSSTAALAVIEVNTMICKTLSRIAHSRLDGCSDGISLARGLMKWLAWTEWKKCRGCKHDQFCFIPLWPLGSAEDFEKPRCVSNLKGVGRDYWHRESTKVKASERGNLSSQSGCQGFSNPLLGSCPNVHPSTAGLMSRQCLGRLGTG